MSIQILGGLARGRTLQVPTGDLIRPTSVMLRRRLFDAHQDMEGYQFIDLCAGSGAVGIEAWSRGANRVHLNEKERKVFLILQKNHDLLKQHYKEDLEQRKLSIGNKDLLQFLQFYQSEYESVSAELQAQTILFLDPPYEMHELYAKAVEKMKNWFKGQLWLESDDAKGLKENKITDLGLEISKIYRQGTSFVAIIK